jgi:hypothetical protein
MCNLMSNVVMTQIVHTINANFNHIPAVVKNGYVYCLPMIQILVDFSNPLPKQFISLEVAGIYKSNKPVLQLLFIKLKVLVFYCPLLRNTVSASDYDGVYGPK